MPESNKWIIFDFDGTLADTLEAGMVVVNSLAKKFGYKQVDQEEIKRLQDKLPGEILKAVGISLWKLPFIAWAVKKQLTAKMPLLNFYPGVSETLRQLKNRGICLAILTTGSLENTNILLEKNNLKNYFEVVYAERNLFGKARILKKILKKYRLDFNNAIYVGDEIRDISAAKQAGIKVAAVTWGVNSKTALKNQNPDFIINKPEELLSINI